VARECGYITKNTSLHSEGPLNPTHTQLERKSRIRTQPWYYTALQTQPNAAPKTQYVLDAAANTQDTRRLHLILRLPPAPGPHLPEITDVSPLYLFLTLVTWVTIDFIPSNCEIYY